MRFGKKFKEVHLLYVKSPKSRLCILHPLSYLRQVAPSQRRYFLSEVLHNIRDLTSSHNFFVTLLARSSPVCSMMHGEESTIKSRNWITFFAFPTTLLSSSVIRRLCRVSSSASVSLIPEDSVSSTGLIWSYLGSNCHKRGSTGLNWSQLVSTGLNWSQVVSTGLK